MDLTFNGSYGYAGAVVRAFAETPHPVSGVMYAQPIGSLDTNALREHFAHSARWKQAAFAAAAHEWDKNHPYAPNPWLGENAPPSPGEPHPVK